MSSPDPAITRRGALAMGAGALAAGATAIIGGPGLSGTAQAAPEARPVKLTPAQLAGQRVIFSYPGLTPPASLLDQISAGQAGGVIFFGENITSLTQIAAVVAQLKAAHASSPVRSPLLLMTDQEGGIVRRLPGEPTLSEKQIGASADPTAAAASAGTGAGQNLAGVGMNLNLAPVLDVYRQAGTSTTSSAGPTARTRPSRPNAAPPSSPPSSGSTSPRRPSTSPAWARRPRPRTPTSARSPWTCPAATCAASTSGRSGPPSRRGCGWS